MSHIDRVTYSVKSRDKEAKEAIRILFESILSKKGTQLTVFDATTFTTYKTKVSVSSEPEQTKSNRRTHDRARVDLVTKSFDISNVLDPEPMVGTVKETADYLADIWLSGDVNNFEAYVDVPDFEDIIDPISPEGIERYPYRKLFSLAYRSTVGRYKISSTPDIWFRGYIQGMIKS